MIKKLVVLFLISLLMSCSTHQERLASTERPESNRFTYQVVADGLDQPFQIRFDNQGFVYWIERTGFIKRMDETTGQIDELGSVPLYEGRSPGLIGFLLDTDFEQTRHIYLYYSAAGDDGNMRLSRFTLDENDRLDPDSEVIILEVPWEQPDSSHFGGGMIWDRDGNLYLSTGDGTRYSDYESIHYLNEEDSTDVYDAARSSGNTNDLRGSILRITPQPDGSYTIPSGNLFEEGTEQTRPEIYVMGTRNPWRLSIDSELGYLLWGDVGPDAGVDSDEKGPMGYDELNVAREAGNFGWPFAIAGRPYHQYDYETRTFGEPYDLEAPVNRSPNNTGLKVLPPIQPSLVAYPYGVSEEWPILSSGSRSVVGGPVFRRADFDDDAPRVFPDYFEGKWLVTDYVRNWIMVITMNENHTEALDIERLLPWDQIEHRHPLDMKFGPSGDLYIVEYGIGGQGRISKYEYNDGNRPPVARATADRLSGAVPLEVHLTSEGTIDYDGDELDFQWVLNNTDNGDSMQFTEANPLVTLDDPGRYRAELTVTDPHGASDNASFEIVAGNEKPEVTLDITSGNRSFYFQDEIIKYRVSVNDQEDGSLVHGTIDPQQVWMTAEYIPSGLSPSQLRELQDEDRMEAGASLRHIYARQLINEYNCTICHQVQEGLIGPSFQEIAERYDGVESAREDLSKGIMNGSTGQWGDVEMPPQPMITQMEAVQIAEYIRSLSKPEVELGRMPLEGEFTTNVYELEVLGPQGDNENRLVRYFGITDEIGSYVFHAHYTDEGSPEIDGLELSNDDIVLLRYPLLGPEEADVFSEEGITFTPSIARHPGFIVSGPLSYIGFKQIDLTGINQMYIGAETRHYNWEHFIGAVHEVRLGSPDGPLAGEPHEQLPPDNSDAEIDVSAVDGVHDVYIVFRNPDAEPEDALIGVWGIGFRR